MKREQEIKLNRLQRALDGYSVSVYKQREYKPTKRDSDIIILKSTIENALKLKTEDKTLEQKIDGFINLAESKVNSTSAPSITGGEMPYLEINELNNEELIGVLKFDAEVKSISLQDAKDYYNKNYSFEGGV